jgi:hypothetical protein
LGIIREDQTFETTWQRSSLFDSLIRHFFEMHLKSARHQGIIGGMATLW